MSSYRYSALIKLFVISGGHYIFNVIFAEAHCTEHIRFKILAVCMVSHCSKL